MLSNLISAFNQTCLSYVAFTVFSLYFCANFKIKKYFDNDLNKNDKTITNFFNTTTTQIDTTATIQIDNIRGENVPNYIFVGISPSANLQGVYDKGATCFNQHNVEELIHNSVEILFLNIRLRIDKLLNHLNEEHYYQKYEFDNVLLASKNSNRL